MPTFTLGSVSYEYLRPPLDVAAQEVHSWEYGHWPRVQAAVPLANGGTVTVYAEALRWTPVQVLVRWADDEGHFHTAWVPTANVYRLTPSEWDIIEYHRCPPELRSVRWANRLPGFLPD